MAQQVLILGKRRNKQQLGQIWLNRVKNWDKYTLLEKRRFELMMYSDADKCAVGEFHNWTDDYMIHLRKSECSKCETFATLFPDSFKNIYDEEDEVVDVIIDKKQFMQTRKQFIRHWKKAHLDK